MNRAARLYVSADVNREFMMGLPLARLPAERHIDDGEQDGVQIGGNGYSHHSGRPDRPHYDRRDHDHREDTCDHGGWVKA